MVSIFDPIKIGKKEIKNRIMFAPTMTNFANIDGSVSDQLVAYIKNIAAGEVGIIVTGHAFIDDIASKGYRYMLGCHRPGLGLERIASAVKEYDCACLMQLNHIGPKADPDFTKGLPRGPVDAVSHFRKKPTDVQMLSIEEIEEIVRAYGRAAARAEEAGFDGVEVHGGHNYLISSFLSPLYNTREDKYGGGLDGRLTIALEVLASIQENVGDDFLVAIRFNGAELVPGGLPQEDGVKVARTFEKLGVDYLSVSQTSTVRKASVPTTFDAAGSFTYLPAAVKKHVSLPVVGVGGLHRPEIIEKALQDGLMDIVAICRGLLADPHLVKKIKEKRQAEQRVCLRCNLCLLRTWEGNPVMCSINPMMGKEASRNLDPVPEDERKKVIVIGGGVAGMEAAWVAARKGHDVTLYEMGGQLGGQVRWAAVIPHMDPFRDLLTSYEARLAYEKVDVRLNTKLDEDAVNALRPDAVIIATGAQEIVPQISGAGRTHVTTSISVLSGETRVSGKVAVIGATMIGCQVALHLAYEGCHVRLVAKDEESDFGANLMMDVVQNALLDRVREKGIEIHPETELGEITGGKIVLRKGSGKPEEIEIDHVVFTDGFVPAKTVAASKLDEGIRVFHVGDCTKPKNVYAAIHQGAKAACQLGGP